MGVIKRIDRNRVNHRFHQDLSSKVIRSKCHSHSSRGPYCCRRPHSRHPCSKLRRIRHCSARRSILTMRRHHWCFHRRHCHNSRQDVLVCPPVLCSGIKFNSGNTWINTVAVCRAHWHTHSTLCQLAPPFVVTNKTILRRSDIDHIGVVGIDGHLLAIHAVRVVRALGYLREMRLCPSSLPLLLLRKT